MKTTGNTKPTPKELNDGIIIINSKELNKNFSIIDIFRNFEKGNNLKFKFIL